MKNKTIIIATSMPTGTITGYFHDMAHQFMVNGYRVIVLLDGKPTSLPEDKESLKFLSWPSLRPTRWSDFLFFYHLIKVESPVMCLSNFGATNVMSIVGYLCKVPNRWNFVHTLLNQIIIDKPISRLKSFFLFLRKKIIYRCNTLLLTNSAGTRTDIIDRYGYNEKKIVVHSFLIEPSKNIYKPRRNRESIILIVGRLSPSKGHDQLLSHFKTLIIDKPNLKLRIVGEGSQRLNLEKKVEGLFLKDSVEFIGNIANRKIGDHYSKSLIHISASTSEAFGMVNIEALREGTPIICTATSGGLDIVNPQKNGEIYDINDTQSLARSICKIINHWDEYSVGALESFQQNFSTVKWPEHLSILEELITNK